MATTLTLNSLVSFYGTYGSDADIEEAVSSIFPRYLQTYSNGTGSSQANTWWADTISLTTGDTNIDLTSGLTDRFGNSLTFTKIKEIHIFTSASSAAAVNISGNFLSVVMIIYTSQFIVLPPGGSWSHRVPVSGLPVTNNVADTLTLAAATATATADLILVGTR